MKDILTEIVEHKRLEVQRFKQQTPIEALCKKVEPLLVNRPSSMSKALLNDPYGIIAEFKRKSPSKGWIKEEGKADVIPPAYQANGAAALSILTDTNFFGGDDGFITVARNAGVTIPVLYKNFVIDEYQLLQARLCGASAVLLIAAGLTKNEYTYLTGKAHELGLEVLLEMHSEEELEYTETLPNMCGINNRNLGTFVTNVENSFLLSEKLPKNVCKVSESGISSPQTIQELREAGFNGFLIGENFMKEVNPGDALAEFIAKIK